MNGDLQFLLRTYGTNCLAYSSLQPGMMHFICDGGYVPFFGQAARFTSPRGRRIVLGDPVCDPAARLDLLRDFLSEHIPTVFYQIGLKTATALASLGVTPFVLGCEAYLRPCDFQLSGGSMSSLRRLCNKAHRESVKVFERPIGQMSREAVRTLSKSWLSRKGGTEFRFSSRPLSYESEESVRYFWAERHDELIGMAVFDPMFRCGRVDGYYQNVLRYSAVAPHGTTDLILVTAINSFRHEGHDIVSLGVAPFSQHPSHDARSCFESVLDRSRFLRLLIRLGWLRYSFEGSQFFRRRYRAQYQETFVAGTEGGSVCEALAVLRAIGIPILRPSWRRAPPDERFR